MCAMKGLSPVAEDMLKATESLGQVTGRKTSRNLKSSPEAVWPREAYASFTLFILLLLKFPSEAALLQGLEAYASLRYTRDMGPEGPRLNLKRNKFLANFIVENTNVSRTAKQVRSRLQHLRGTTQDERVKRLILGGLVLEDSTEPLATRRPFGTSESNYVWAPDTPFQVQICLHSDRHLTLPPLVSSDTSFSLPHAIRMPILLEWRSFTHRLRGRHPLIGIRSPVRLKEYCQWRVSLYETSWVTPANFNCDSMSDGDWRYTADFAADLWDMICDNHDVGWVIQQYLFDAEDAVSTEGRLAAEIVHTFEADRTEPTSQVLRGNADVMADRNDVNPAPQFYVSISESFPKLIQRDSLMYTPKTSRRLATILLKSLGQDLYRHRLPPAFSAKSTLTQRDFAATPCW
ncbi:hypothetical protein C8J57DRAFT_1245645 [Mycena rebaudengoi]|nr:hypothetical protein C8J57DRAFT_1245645 [Mycena rebaudengoi]